MPCDIQISPDVLDTIAVFGAVLGGVVIGYLLIKTL